MVINNRLCYLVTRKHHKKTGGLSKTEIPRRNMQMIWWLIFWYRRMCIIRPFNLIVFPQSFIPNPTHPHLAKLHKTLAANHLYQSHPNNPQESHGNPHAENPSRVCPSIFPPQASSMSSSYSPIRLPFTATKGRFYPKNPSMTSPPVESSPINSQNQEVGKFKDMFIYVNAMNNDEYTYTDYTTLDPVGICKFGENHNPTHQQRTNLRPPNLSLISSSGPSTKEWIKVLKFSSAKTEMPGNGSARRELNSIPGGWGWLMLVDVGPLNP